MKWFRLYTDILDDPKLVRLADDEYRAFTYLLAIAAEEEKEGLIPHETSSISWRARLSLDLVSRTLEKLQQENIIKKTNAGWNFIHWNKRQFRSDNRGARWMEWYYKQKSNIGSNIGSKGPEQSRAEQSINKYISSSDDDGFDVFWLNYPKKIGKGAARRAWKKIHSKKEVLEKLKSVLPRQKQSEQWTKENGQFIPNPATYLNQGRWEDETI